jgi:hypothetical protein
LNGVALGLDCLIVALVMPQALGQPQTAGSTLIAVLLVFLLLCYCTVDLLLRVPVPQRGSSPHVPVPAELELGHERRRFRLKLALLATIIALVVIVPTLTAIAARRGAAPQQYIGDSALQVEEDAAFLLQGTDYYARTFFDTPLARWWPVGPPNPALYHADELPCEVVLAAVLSVPFRAVFGWFDVRVLYLVAFCAALGFALGLARGPTARLALVAGLGLNPLFVSGTINGNDDVLVLVAVLALAACARRGWSRATLVLLGVACATKYTALPLVPFVLLYLAGQRRHARGTGADSGVKDGRGWIMWLLKALGWVALPQALLVGPFLLWNAGAYLASTIGFISGTVVHSFPIRGPEAYGVATFVLQGHLVRSPQDYFPFGLLQAVAGLPLLWLLLRRQWRDNMLQCALAGYATVFLVVSYFARFFHGSHLAYGVALFLLAGFLGEQRAGVLPTSPYAGAPFGPPREAAVNGAARAVTLRSLQDAVGGGTHVRLDFLVLLLLVPQVLARPTGRMEQLAAASALLLLVAYAVVAAVGGVARQGSRRGHTMLLQAQDGMTSGAWTPLQGPAADAPRPMDDVRRIGGTSSAGRAARLQTVLLLLLIGLLAVWPAVYGTLARHHSAPETYITDNALQVEEATSFLLADKNPYAVTYVRTPMARWYASPALSQALYHADELPANLVLTAPVLALARATLGWFDERFLLLPLLGLIAWLLWCLGGSSEERRARLAAVLLGPFLVPSLVYGDTDVILLAALAGALVAARARRLILAAFLVGGSLAIKQTAIFLCPLFLAYLWGMAPADLTFAGKVRHVWRYGRWMVVLPVATIGPFLLWNGPAFVASTIGFAAGTVPHSYPIRGVGAYGFSAIVVLGKLVSSPQAYFPFSPFQLLTAGSLLASFCWVLARRPSLPLLIASYAVVLGFAYFFSRFLQESGVGFILLAIALSCLVSPAEPARGCAPVTDLFTNRRVSRGSARGAPAPDPTAEPLLQAHAARQQGGMAELVPSALNWVLRPR